MNREQIRALLESVGRGETAPDQALEALARAPFVDTPHGRVDTHRALRQGLPEVIYAPGKSAEQIAGIARALEAAGQPALVTRVAPELAAEILERLPAAEYTSDARLVWLGPAEPEMMGKGTIAVICAGTADLPVAREAAEVARRFGNKVELLADVGVAGVHRLLDAFELIRAARVLIVVAGMEGALPSVVGGMVDRPVIAVPTSVGYGTSFGGLAALLGMLNSCASNVAVVNVDNGFGAAVVATLINRL